MPDEILPNGFQFSGPGRRKGKIYFIPKYDHLMDGKLRKVNAHDYGVINAKRLAVNLRTRAWKLGLRCETQVLDELHVAFRAHMLLLCVFKNELKEYK